jgi:hypothetical protein
MLRERLRVTFCICLLLQKIISDARLNQACLLAL